MLIRITIISIIIFGSLTLVISNINPTNHKETINKPLHPKLANSVAITNVIIKDITPEEISVKKYFDKVSKVPYKANYKSQVPKTPEKFWKDNSGDCDDKSIAFAHYLYTKGATDLWIITITHKSNKYSHSCVMWKNRIFDPTSVPPIYNCERSRYYKSLQKDGFQLWAATTYTPDIIETKEKLAENGYILKLISIKD